MKKPLKKFCQKRELKFSKCKFCLDFDEIVDETLIFMKFESRKLFFDKICQNLNCFGQKLIKQIVNT